MVSSDVLSSLERERDLVFKLLVRNRNQHGKALCYGFLSKAVKLTKLLPLEHISIAQTVIVNDLCRSAQAGGSSSKDSMMVNGLVSSLEDSYKIIAHFLEISYWITRASIEFVGALSRRVFVPLYTTLLASSARIFKCTTIIIMDFHAHWTSLSQQLQHAISPNLKLNQLIASAIENAKLTSLQSEWISYLRTSETSKHLISSTNGSIRRNSSSSSITSANNNMSIVTLTSPTNTYELGAPLGSVEDEGDILDGGGGDWIFQDSGFEPEVNRKVVEDEAIISTVWMSDGQPARSSAAVMLQVWDIVDDRSKAQSTLEIGSESMVDATKTHYQTILATVEEPQADSDLQVQETDDHNDTGTQSAPKKRKKKRKLREIGGSDNPVITSAEDSEAVIPIIAKNGADVIQGDADTDADADLRRMSTKVDTAPKTGGIGIGIGIGIDGVKRKEKKRKKILDLFSDILS